MYTIEVTPRAVEELYSLQGKYLLQIRDRIDDLARNPRPAGCRKLREIDHLYRIRSGVFRILYQIDDKQGRVLIVRVGHRKGVYRRLPRLNE